MKPKHAPAAKPEPAQPLLPRINLATCLLDESMLHICPCPYCPPWLHRLDQCQPLCPFGSVPPVCNTGVHVLGSAAASEVESVLDPIENNPGK